MLDNRGSNIPLDLKYLLLHHLLLEIILPILSISWETGGQEISRKIIAVCPSNFLPEDVLKMLQNGN
ncbi:hypothetical protein Pst134EA_027853 [Puccinia striiformis f. sp. tritici]|uniref:hypothetical protein n=1 Tax=Puccinia striiformis f. sp. tritici TaxID=168172 RepID=UPI002008937B|nr:hypothetical protein Pst134EA_027853 [Puccinia striiformis f. sp. tritici]KAH9448543.1 hypothetical protein Pst134EA_027853 [Puccinia striiformis f. sp. tritici]